MSIKFNLVSVVITTHNRICLLKRAIDSVLSQTYDNIECIVVSDNSSDGTDEYCNNIKGIKFISIPLAESRGGNYARNLGIKASKGEYIAFLDDDDYWLPDKILKQVNLIEQEQSVMVYCGRRNEILTPKDIIYEDKLPSKNLYGDMSKKILTRTCTTTTNMLVRKDTLLSIGMFDEELRFWQEYELCIRLAQEGPFHFVNEPLSVYRIDKSDPNRLTNKYTEWLKAVKYVKKKHKSLFSKLTIQEKMHFYHFFCGDASIRCKAAGFKYRFYLYRLMYKFGNIILK